MYTTKWRIAVMMLGGGLALSACGGQDGSSEAAAGGDEGSEFPSQDIRMIVPYGAGGSTDTLVRTFAPALEEDLGQTIVVENMPGASGAVAVEELMGSEPDGHTAVWGTSGPLAVNPTIGDVSYSIDDYELVSLATINPYVLVAKADSEYQSAEQLFQAAKDKPGEVTIGTPGRTTIQSILLQSMAEEAGVELTLVPFEGGANSLNAVLGGNVDASFNVLSEVRSQIEAGELVGLGVSTDEPSQFLPDVPPLSKQGIEPPAEGGPTGLMLPSGTGEDVVQRWVSAFNKASADPEIIKQLEKVGAAPANVPSGEAKEVIQAIADAASKAVE